MYVRTELSRMAGFRRLQKFFIRGEEEARYKFYNLSELFIVNFWRGT